MLIKDPVKRPSMRKILEKEFLSKRISNLLTSTIAKNEFSSTFVKKHLEPHQEESKEEAISVEDVSSISMKPAHKGLPAPSKSEAAKKKKRGGEDDGGSEFSTSNFDVSEAKEKIQVVKGKSYTTSNSFYRFKPTIQELLQAYIKRIARFSVFSALQARRGILIQGG